MDSKTIAHALCPFLLTGCLFRVGPDYTPPELSAPPDQWSMAVGAQVSETDAPMRAWWLIFEDPTLTTLIERAHTSNLSVALAVARLAEARAQLGIQRADRYPNLTGSGAVERQRGSDGVSVAPPPQSRTDTIRQLSLESSWEWDLWGRVRRSIEAERATFAAQQEDLRDVLVLIYAEIGTRYIRLRALQERLRLAQINVQLQQETLSLVAARNKAQLAPDSEVRQAELNLAATEAAVPSIETSIAQSIHQLSVLLGEQPQQLRPSLAWTKPLPDTPDSLSVSLPADTIRQRPDIRRAERTLASQTALIGVATAELFPNFFINGDFGFGTATGELVSSDNRSWGIGPVFSWNLFNAGRVRNSINAQEARTEQALISYEETVLTALQDVEDSLIAYFNEQRRRAALARSVLAAQQAAELIRELYRRGLTDFQNVLDAQRSLFSQQDDLAASQGEVLINLINVYRSFGGGWLVLDELGAIN
ncbi:MAG: efflux transporter outer membrane subunit [Pseudomonadota bacterium]